MEYDSTALPIELFRLISRQQDLNLQAFAPKANALPFTLCLAVYMLVLNLFIAFLQTNLLLRRFCLLGFSASHVRIRLRTLYDILGLWAF